MKFFLTAHTWRPLRRNVMISSSLAILNHAFHASTRLKVIKPFILADIGEGIREVQIIQWFVKPGARVEQFDKLCEVQSDKASVEITSRFDGVVKKLHYDADDMALVGKPLLDIDIQSEITPEDEALTTPPTEQADLPESQQPPLKAAEVAQGGQYQDRTTSQNDSKRTEDRNSVSGRHATLATPAVRHLTKELNVSIADVQGTGKDGRVLKEDVQRFAAGRTSPSSSAPPSTSSNEDRTIALTPVQSMMFETMTKSLTIPHFLYSDSFDMTAITMSRKDINQAATSSKTKISALAFIIKAVSLAMTDFPILNARLNTSNPDKPQIAMRGAHNVGVAVDTPQGLIVPVIKGANELSIAEIAVEINRLSSLAKDGKLSAADLTGGTFTVSNVGSIGGTVVSPVIVEGQVAILGVGKARIVPAFDVDGVLVKRQECVLSWSADHRVVDGATVARAAEVVRMLLEQPARMLVRLR